MLDSDDLSWSGDFAQKLVKIEGNGFFHYIIIGFGCGQYPCSYVQEGDNIGQAQVFFANGIVTVLGRPK